MTLRGMKLLDRPHHMEYQSEQGVRSELLQLAAFFSNTLTWYVKTFGKINVLHAFSYINRILNHKIYI